MTDEEKKCEKCGRELSEGVTDCPDCKPEEKPTELSEIPCAEESELMEIEPCIDDDIASIIIGLDDKEKAKLLEKYAEPFEYFEMVDGEKRMLPYPNEHACRLKDPDDFTSFRRTSRSSDGKMYDIIWGIKDGKAEEQAYRYPKTIWSVEQAKSHCTGHNGILFEPAKNPSLTIWENVDPEEEYVLSWDAIESNDVPPKGLSGVTPEKEATIPDRFKWWLFDDERTRIKIRDSYRETTGIGVTILNNYEDGRYLIECSLGEHFLVKFHVEPTDENARISMADVSERVPVKKLKVEDFTLMHHFWRSPKPIQGESVTEHWDLFIGNKQIVCTANIVKEKTFAIIRKPYSIGFHMKGNYDYEYLKPGEPGNPTKNIPSWIKRIDSGVVTVIEESPKYMLMLVRGVKIWGRYELNFIEGKNVWEMQKVKSNLKKLSRALSKDETVFRTTINMQLSRFEMQGEDLMVEGTALSFGVWNGEYFPEEAIMDKPERVMGIPIAVGSHATTKNSGEVTHFEAKDGSIWIRGIIPKKFKMEQERVMSGEFVGFSVEVDVLADEQRRIIKKILGYDRVVLVDMPACSVCTLDKACAV